MDDLLTESNNIIQSAIKTYKPYAIVAMVSGGGDSLTALEVATVLGVKIDFIMHGITGTGVKSTTEHVRKTAVNYSAKYIEADAGNMYERIVTTRGFWGIGHKAHSMAYHQLKQQQFNKALSKHIRKRQRNKNILLINGARVQESANRKKNMLSPIRAMGKGTTAQKNIWVNIIHDWGKRDCNDFLKQQGVKKCPASLLCHRSGECMCGTMQSKKEAEEVSYWFPEWGEWLDNINRRVFSAGFNWAWGEDMPPEFKARKQREKELAAGQLDLFEDYLPMCHSCNNV
jgi:3'-phosphoadenosine 5'-phosphosulfate sulfotransferase (PAPS reductase)/FAD synthetase